MTDHALHPRHPSGDAVVGAPAEQAVGVLGERLGHLGHEPDRVHRRRDGTPTIGTAGTALQLPAQTVDDVRGAEPTRMEPAPR